ncbi:MAG: hypothetical protein ACO1RT_19600, partial [Planctomycetaceae bacterium]
RLSQRESTVNPTSTRMICKKLRVARELFYSAAQFMPSGGLESLYPWSTYRMIKYFWPVTEADVRQTSWSSHCCHCGERIGAEHRPSCMIRQRTVVVQFENEIELIAWFPEAWPLDMVAAYYDGGVDMNLAMLWPGLEGRQPTSQCMKVTDIREATDEDEENLPEWPI